MVESALTKRKISFRLKITVKSLISAGIIALAVILPQFVHLFAGAQGGVRWLPMYLPVLLGGCLLGWSWGLGIGVLSPLTSFFITSAFGNPMPIAARLPFMMIELAIFAGISGLFSKKDSKKCVDSVPGRSFGTTCRQKRIYDFGFASSIGNTVCSCRHMGTNSSRTFWNAIAIPYRAADRYRP